MRGRDDRDGGLWFEGAGRWVKIGSVIERQHVRQNPGEEFRRCFTDDNFDLVVWYGPDDAVVGFELCYDRAKDEKAVRWLGGEGLSHFRVDTGEQLAPGNRSAMLVDRDGEFEADRVIACFEAAADGLPVEVAAVVKSKLRGGG